MRQLLSGEQTDWGKIGQEAALSAVPFGIGRAAKFVKGANAAGKAGEGLVGTTKAGIQSAKSATVRPTTTETAMQAMKPGIVQRTGQRLTRVGSGLKVGPGVGDINRLDEQAEFMARKGFTGTPEQQLRAMSQEMGSLSRQVDDVLASKPISVSGQNVAQNIYKASTDPNVFPDLDVSAPTVQRIMQANATKVQNIANAKELNDYVKTINKAASQARAKLDDPKARALSPAETAALATKRLVDDELGGVTDIAPLKKEMAQIFDINPAVAKTSEKAFTLPFLAGGFSARGPVQSAKGAASRIGATLQGSSPKPISGFRPFLRQAIPAAAAQLGTRAIANPLINGTQPQDETVTDVNEDAGLLSGASLPGASTGSAPSQGMQLNDAAMRALQAGDIKSYAVLADAADRALKMEQSQEKKNKPLSAEAARTLSNAKAGLSNIDKIEELLTGDPGLQQRGGVSGTFNPFGITGGVLGTGEYDNAREQIRDVIGRIRTGATLTKEESMVFDKFLPQPGDSTATVQQKLKTLRDQFQFILENSGSASSDLMAALE